MNTSTIPLKYKFPFSCSENNWFVIVVQHNTELKIQAMLKQEAQINSFIPMQRTRKRDARGRFYYEEKIAIHNYVFVNSSYNRLNELRTSNDRHYDFHFLKKDHYEGNVRIGRVPVTIPKHEMNNFIAIAGSTQEKVRFLNTDNLDLTQGQRVRIISGDFAGVEGIYMRTSKKHERRVVVQLEGIATVATTALPAAFVEKIE
jgi:transcription antitermination factor NusG